MKNREVARAGSRLALALAPVAGLFLAFAALSPAAVAAAGMVPPPALAYSVAENGSLFVPNSAMLAGQPGDVYVQTTDLTESPPEWGKITGSDSGIAYVPQADYVGPDAFSYTVCQPNDEGAPTCLTNMVSVTVGANGTPSAVPSSVGTPVASATGGVGAATGKPRVTPPSTADLGGSTPADDSAGWLVLVGLGTILAGALLLVPAGQRRTGRRSR